ncbi:hypothetical protein [Xanthomonas sacchari]|uniref:hypothetical protein n=1 Tax=Xanthomonas sacchari TaxID=56458 RepID=UPI0022593188|nr:hypothetical protein [Xanthomonas sacchari]
MDVRTGGTDERHGVTGGAVQIAVPVLAGSVRTHCWTCSARRGQRDAAYRRRVSHSERRRLEVVRNRPKCVPSPTPPQDSLQREARRPSKMRASPDCPTDRCRSSN